MPPLESFLLAGPGGLHQSRAEPQPGDLDELKNFALFRGRVGLRAPLQLIATLQDDQAAPVDVDNVLDIVDHEGKLYTLSYSSGQQDVYLHSMQVDGTTLTLEGTAYSGVSSKPTLKMTSFEGGTATSGTSRLYISDYNQNLVTKYWNGASFITLQEDLDNDGDATDDVTFSLMIPYKFHLWGTGFFEEGSNLRPEMLRFSQPGLVPANEGTGNDPKEWWSTAHREVGRRGDKIRALSRAGDRLIVFQKRATHAIFGSGAETWTRQELSSVIGCVGPYAVTAVDERLAYFWASDGPYVTNGSEVRYIGGPIRQLAVDVDAAEDATHVGYSPDDGMVYFLVSPGGADDYSLALAYDHRNQRWMKAEWLVGASTAAEFGAVEFLDSAAAPGPEGAPSSLSASAQSDTQIDLSWTNGDVNVNTETHIYRSTSTGFTPNDATNRIATLESGADSYSDTGLTQDTQYFYKARHFRNTSHSSESNEASDTTWLQEPTGLGLAGLTDGLTVSGTNNATGADIEIQRKTSATSFSTITTLTNPGGSFSYDDTGLTCGTEYFYRARASKAGSTTSEWSSTVSRAACDATTIPSDPSGLSATANSETKITVTWSDNSDNEDEFELHRSTDGGSTYSLHATLTPNTVSYEDTGLTSDTTYHYKVRACNDEGCSGFSNSDSATTDPNLDAPADLSATTVDASSIDLDWTDTADDEDAWEVHQSDDGGSTYSKVATLGANSVDYTATGLSADTTYHYKVRATKGTTSGSFSNEASATTDGTPPSAPSSLTATKDGTNPESQINLSWTAPNSDQDDQEIHRNAGGGYSKIATVAANDESYQDTGLSSGTQYCYKVRACNVDGCSSFSNEDCATTDGTAGPPADPTGLSATGDDADLSGTEVSAVDVSWTDNADDEDEYIVERCEGSGCSTFSVIATLPADTESYRDTGVTDNPTTSKTYRYQVKASNASGDSNYAGPVDATVEPQVTPSNVSASDTTFCDGPDLVGEITVTWDDGDVTGLEKREVLRSVDGGAYSVVATFTSSPEDVESYEDQDVTFTATSYEYKIRDDHGSTGENTGTFTSDASNAANPEELDCSGGSV